MTSGSGAFALDAGSTDLRIASHLAPRPANHVPLTPVEFLVRSAEVYPQRAAVAWNGRLWTYAAFARMVTRFAHTWSVTAAGRLHVCLDRPDPALIFPAIEAHGVTHRLARRWC